MIKKIDSKNMGSSDHGWLRSKFHFSFADYYNPNNINFGVLRVINDDLIEPGTGFETHPHKDMEIISYVVNGELTHGDNMGNKNTISRGQVQYMSAGSGVYHSEHNMGKDILRLLQIWIFPNKRDLDPTYGDYRFAWDDRQDKWLLMVSSISGEAPIKINQDVNIYSLALDQGKEIHFSVKDDRQAYLVQIEGSSIINHQNLSDQDALEIRSEDLQIKATTPSHMLLIEMHR